MCSLRLLSSSEGWIVGFLGMGEEGGIVTCVTTEKHAFHVQWDSGF